MVSASRSGSVARLGLDLDNTVIDYGPAYIIVARKLGLEASLGDRASIRSALRTDDGDEEWQRFQSLLYTSGLDAAVPAPGLSALIECCRERRIPISIISHKTQTTPSRFGTLDLHAPALAWLIEWGVVPAGVAEKDVHFCHTLEQKTRTVGDTRCSVFVDDLAAVLDDLSMSRNLARVHLGARAEGCGDHVHAGNLSEVVPWLTMS